MTEQAMNPYASPQTQVADMAPDEGVGELRLFSARGRIGRLRYLAYTTGVSVIHSVVVGVLTMALASSTTALMGVSLLALAALVWFSFLSAIKRCHDIGISGWWSLTAIIPVIALAWIFWPGNRGANRFGAPPPPNTWGVRILGLIMPVLFFVGILAAVAIPQYKNYTDKARAAQAAGQR